MPDQAHIASIEAIEAFRNDLVIYREKARLAVHEILGEISRCRMWLQHDRRPYWAREVKRRALKLAQVKQDRFNAELSEAQNAGDLRLAERSARKSRDEALDKLAEVKRWMGLYEGQVAPLVKHPNRIAEMLDRDVPRAIASLTQMIETLDAYTLHGTGGEAAEEGGE